MPGSRTETIYFGKRPNCVQIYAPKRHLQHQRVRRADRVARMVKIAAALWVVITVVLAIFTITRF